MRSGVLSLRALREWSFWSFAFPAHCVYCARDLKPSDVLFCDACWAELPRAEKTPAERRPKHVDWLHSGFAYRDGGLTREIVHAMKFDGQTALAPRMAQMLVRTIPTGFLSDDLIFVPVPLHWLRQGDRAFNQSELLCHELTKLCGGRVTPLLKRVRNTPAQSGQGARTRAENVKDAFRYRAGAVPESVVLVDDVVTTGATVSECARVLKAEGVQQVRVLSFAHAD
ncbi:MAG: ComF family protein [bacterium]|nr:ComF family protein [bacterium]